MRLVDPTTAQHYRASGWWADDTVADAVAGHVDRQPHAVAYLGGDERLTWIELHERALALAGGLARAGVERGERVGVWVPDSPLQHLIFLALEHAGATVVGIGSRAGRREVERLLAKANAPYLVTAGDRTDAAAAMRASETGRTVAHITVSSPHGDGDIDGAPLVLGALDEEERARRRLGPDDLFLVNSTSGTTGLPKAVLHTQNRWRYFHQQAVANGRLDADDVFLAAVPGPFGFGIWTSHVTPLLLGATTILLDRFEPGAAIEAIERHRATVLACVSTQFIMMLASPELSARDLSSLRVVFTGGEAVPYERARAFEEATGATILQFYGSNETGLLSGTTLDDPPDRRLRTAGRVVPEMQVRLFDRDRDVTDRGRGRPGCRGPATSLGYLDDDDANAELFTPDGWMLMADLCEIDADGYLTVVGRASDIIIRGGKNISAIEVEADVASHPAVVHAAAVAMPDPVFGERVCAYVELLPGSTLDLPELVAHLSAQGISKELYPERLIVVDELPRTTGAKVAKGELREDIRRRLAAEEPANRRGDADPPIDPTPLPTGADR